jgi:tetratricopeptide (TPR) repeat protein/DNA-binding XRE family transcriptional regulator
MDVTMVSEPLFGQWLRRRRKALDLSQKELARRVECSPATIRKIEAEQRRPSKALASRLAHALQIDDEERQAFLTFARRGWSDAPTAPAGGLPAGALPLATLPPASLPLATLPTASLPPASLPPDSLPAGLRGPPSATPSRGASDPGAEVDPSDGSEGVFVARDRELAKLEHHLDEALAGGGRVVFVSGEPGSGKTTLMNEFARRSQLARPGLLCAAGRCEAFGGVGDPYLPFRDLLTALCGAGDSRRGTTVGAALRARRLREASPWVRSVLLEHGPDLVDVFVPAGVVAASLGDLSARSQPQLFEQYVRVLERVASRSPLLLLIDDLQWVDGASVDLLFHLGRRLAGSRVLLIGAYRADEVAVRREGTLVPGRHPLEPVVRELGRVGEGVVDLDDVGRDEARRFVDALLDSEPNTLGEEFRATLLRRTEGHPLFVVELLRSMQARGDLPRDGQGRWRQGATIDWRSLPERVDAVVGQRIARLEDGLRAALGVASVEGEVFTAEVVARVQGVDELQLIRYLSQELDRRHGLVREWEPEEALPGRGARFGFRHALFRQYLYDGLGSAERRLLHGRVARALVELHADRIDDAAVQLAHHFGRAGERERESAYLYRAGLRAQRLAALPEAVQSYRAALERWPEADPKGRAEALSRLSECLWVVGLLGEAMEVSEQARDALTELKDRLALGGMERQIGRLYWELGDRAQSMTHYRAALQVLEQEPPSPALAAALGSMAQMHMLAAEFDRAVEWGERALALAERLEAKSVVVHALCSLGFARAAMGDPTAGMALLQRSLRDSIAMNLPHDAGRAFTGIAELLHGFGRYRELESLNAEMLAYVERMHLPLFIDAARIRTAALAWSRGEWASVLASGGWREQSEGSSEGHRYVVASTLRGVVWNDLGDPKAALRELEGSRHTARTADELQLLLPHVAQLLRALAAVGAAPRAREVAEEIRLRVDGIRYIDPASGVTPVLFACHWFAGNGALEHARSCESVLGRAEAQMGSPLSRAAWAEAQGAVALVASDSDGAARHLEAAVAAWSQLGHPLDELRALESLERALRETGDRERAMLARSRARAIEERLAAELEEPGLRRAFLEWGAATRSMGAAHRPSPR